MALLLTTCIHGTQGCASTTQGGSRRKQSFRSTTEASSSMIRVLFTHKVHPDGGDVALRVGVVGEPQQQTRLSHTRVSDQQQLKQVVTGVVGLFVRLVAPGSNESSGGISRPTNRRGQARPWGDTRKTAGHGRAWHGTTWDTVVRNDARQGCAASQASPDGARGGNFKKQKTRSCVVVCRKRYVAQAAGRSPYAVSLKWQVVMCWDVVGTCVLLCIDPLPDAFLAQQ